MIENSGKRVAVPSRPPPEIKSLCFSGAFVFLDTQFRHKNRPLAGHFGVGFCRTNSHVSSYLLIDPVFVLPPVQDIIKGGSEEQYATHRVSGTNPSRDIWFKCRDFGSLLIYT